MEEDLGPSYEGVAEFYDYFSTQEDLPFYLDYARKQGDPVLDIGAGTGRVSRYLAGHGFEVTAVENSPSMINHFMAEMDELDSEVQGRISLVEADMCDFDLDKVFKLIIIPASFGHAMTTEDQLATLGCIHRHLSPDGVFILDLYPAGTMDEHSRFEENPVELPDGRIVKRQGVIECDLVRQLMRVELTYKVRDPGSDEDAWNKEIRIMSGAALIYNREADLLVKSARFRLVDEFGGFDKARYHSKSSRRIMILEKT